MISRRRLLAFLPPTLIFCNSAAVANGIGRDSHVLLPNGRRLGLSEYGASSGTVVLYLHGTPSCRLEAGLLASIAESCNVRLIAIDRPGMGNSTYYSFDQDSYAADVAGLIESLRTQTGQRRFGVLAMSGGTSYGLACGQLLPNDLSAIAILAPRTPFAPGVPITALDEQLKIANKMPRLTGWFLKRQLRLARRNSDRAAQQQLRAFSAVDQQFMKLNAETFREIFIEAAKCGTSGVQSDFDNIRWPWNCCMQQIHLPVAIYRGGLDITSPIETTQFLQRSLPDSRSFTFPKDGHFTLTQSASSEALRWLASHADLS